MYSAEDLFTEDADDDLERIVEGDGDDQYGDGGADGETAEGAGGGDDNEGDNQATDGGQAKTKRVVRNPQPKLNADTLRSTRGLLCLETLFNRVKYKGRGHEEHDLNMVLKTYEYWCHRMFPKLPFDDCIAKLEKLGTKKPVQAYLKRIRFDLLTDSDEIPQAVPPDELENDGGDNETDLFDTLRPESDPQSLQLEQQWTDEQLKRLEENRLHAQRIKMDKLKKIQEKATSVMERSDAANYDRSLSQRVDEFPDEFEEVTIPVNQQTSKNPTSMEVEGGESEGLQADLVEPNSETDLQDEVVEQWSDEQLKRLEENRQRAAKLRLERQRKLQGVVMEENHDGQVSASSAENIQEASDRVMPGSSRALMSPTFAQELDSLNTKEDNIDAPGSQDTFANAHNENIAQDTLGVDEMETEPILSPTNQETLLASLCVGKVAMEVEESGASLEQAEIATNGTVILNDDISNTDSNDAKKAEDHPELDTPTAN